MTYAIVLKPRAVKDLKALPKAVQRRVIARIEALRDNLAGDVKKLTNFTPESTGYESAIIVYYSRWKTARWLSTA